MRCYR
ncbi:hypothetical protein E2C01_098396 [Portunus trituberculatus]